MPLEMLQGKPGQETSAVITGKQEEKAAALKERHGRKGIAHCTLGDEVAWKATDSEE